MSEECEVCRDGVEAFEERQEELMEKHGWVTHYVFDDKTLMINCHTHGLVEKFGHPDLQIVLPLPGKTCNGIMHTCVERIEKGEVLSGVVDHILSNDYLVLFVPAKEGGRDVMRLILPDKDQNLYNFKDNIYAKQRTVR